MKSQTSEQKLSEIANLIAKKCQKAGLSYDQTRYIFKLVRTSLDLRPARATKVVKRSLSETQIESFFKVIKNPNDLLMFKLMYSCALRVSALVGLKKKHICLEELTVNVEFNKTNGGVIPFPKSLKQLLQMFMHANNHEQLFVSSHNRAYSTRAIQLKFKHYAKIAGLPSDVSVHCLRHSVLTRLASKGLTSSQLQAISLHRSKTSLDSYIRLSGVEVRDKYDEVMI
jgi:site-specific recombinase XerD